MLLQIIKNKKYQSQNQNKAQAHSVKIKVKVKVKVKVLLKVKVQKAILVSKRSHLKEKLLNKNKVYKMPLKK